MAEALLLVLVEEDPRHLVVVIQPLAVLPLFSVHLLTCCAVQRCFWVVALAEVVLLVQVTELMLAGVEDKAVPVVE
jgi:hypothetical protein